MEWRDEGLIIGLRRHGETAAIVELMTRDHGRHMGIVRGGRSHRMQPMLQPGNSLTVVWRARIEEQLGTFTVEPIQTRAAAIMASGLALQGVNLLGALLRLLPERDPLPAIYETAELIAGHLDDARICPTLLVRLELAVLSELGFGLDLSVCAATGASEDLIYVSPKSGRAVSRSAGEPWRDRLLALPGFLIGQLGAEGPLPGDIAAGFALTGFFLERNVYRPRGISPPPARQAFLQELEKLG